MASGINIGDQVYVNANRLNQRVNCPGALYSTTVVDRNDRSVKINLPAGLVSDWISTKYVHRKAGIAILQFGDYHNEAVNLDPLAKGILQNARILYGDDASVQYWKIRSTSELEYLFENRMLNFADKIVLIAHGSKDGELSIGAKQIGAQKIGKLAEIAPHSPPDGWEFVCAVCHSRRASFGKILSSFKSVNCVIGPMHQSHSSEMAQFIQTYLNFHLLAGFTTTVAAKYARHSATGEATFRMWKNGIRQSLSYN